MSELVEYTFNHATGPRLIMVGPDGVTTASIYLDASGILRSVESELKTPSALSLSSNNGCFGGLAINDHFTATTTAGAQNWTTTTNGTSAANSIVAGAAGHPGIVQLATGTTAAGRASLAQGLTGIFFGSGSYRFDSCIKHPILTHITSSYITRIGFGNNTGAGDMLDGAYFEYSGSNWYAKTSNNSIRTAIDTLIPTNTDWTVLSIIVKDTTTASFYIGTGSVGTIYTNIPSTRSTGIIHKIESITGSLSKTLWVDATSISYQSTL